MRVECAAEDDSRDTSYLVRAPGRPANLLSQWPAASSRSACKTDLRLQLLPSVATSSSTYVLRACCILLLANRPTISSCNCRARLRFVFGYLCVCLVWPVDITFQPLAITQSSFFPFPSDLLSAAGFTSSSYHIFPPWVPSVLIIDAPGAGALVLGGTLRTGLDIRFAQQAPGPASGTSPSILASTVPPSGCASSLLSFASANTLDHLLSPAFPSSPIFSKVLPRPSPSLPLVVTPPCSDYLFFAFRALSAFLM